MVERFLVHDVPVKAAAPSTHAIVIGVGDYPHLPDGSSERKTKDHANLEQLTSPPISARKFASWLIGSFEHPEKPLATVSLLLSESKPKPFVNPRTREKSGIKLADFENTETAIQDWIKRGNLNPNNLLLFFFCGHGLALGPDLALLLADYGADEFGSLKGAIDFRRFRLGMNCCRASEQCFFVDACRTESEILKDATARTPIQAGTRETGPTWSKLYQPIFYSTMHGEKAYSIPKQPSIYTEALLQGMRDLAAQDSTGHWRVNTIRLLEAVDHVVRRRALELKMVVPPSGDAVSKIDLNRLNGPPKALLYVTTHPPEALRDVAIACKQEGFKVVTAQLESDKAELVVQLPAGRYDFTATFPGRLTCERSCHVNPIFYTLEFRRP
jgi:hypothetical protein